MLRPSCLAAGCSDFSSLRLLYSFYSPFEVQIRRSRRTTGPPPWVAPKYDRRNRQLLTDENESFLRESHGSTFSPLKQEPWERGTWKEGSKRTGLIVQKIGMMPQWTVNGDRMLCTLLKVLDNHVIKYNTAREWFEMSKVGKRKAYGRFGPMGRVIVGAGVADPQLYTDEYRRQFDRIGVLPKEHLGGFTVTPDAKIEPGTRLHATHFRVGQYVDVSGKSIDFGFQGVVHRWGFRGGPSDQRGSTKFHRRPGSTGSSGDAKIWPGKRLPGHMGWEWRHIRGLLILRINVKEQVLYVKGNCMGEADEILLMKDSFVENKIIQNPPFPTHYPDEETEPFPDEYFYEKLYQFTQPTIMFEEGEEDDYAKMARSKEVKKQAKAKKK